jgi:glycerol-3-phosphate acyltransferase PlsX
MLGVAGACIISHGRSDARAISNAVNVAREFVAGRVNERIQRSLKEIVA